MTREDDGVTLVEYGVAIVLAIMVGTPTLIVLAGQLNTNLGEADTIMADRSP